MIIRALWVSERSSFKCAVTTACDTYYTDQSDKWALLNHSAYRKQGDMYLTISSDVRWIMTLVRIGLGDRMFKHKIKLIKMLISASVWCKQTQSTVLVESRRQVAHSAFNTQSIAITATALEEHY